MISTLHVWPLSKLKGSSLGVSLITLRRGRGTTLCEMALPFVAGILSKWTPDSKEAVCPDKGTPGRSQGSPAEIVSIFLMFNRLS